MDPVAEFRKMQEGCQQVLDQMALMNVNIIADSWTKPSLIAVYRNSDLLFFAESPTLKETLSSEQYRIFINAFANASLLMDDLNAGFGFVEILGNPKLHSLLAGQE